MVNPNGVNARHESASNCFKQGSSKGKSGLAADASIANASIAYDSGCNALLTALIAKTLPGIASRLNDSYCVDKGQSHESKATRAKGYF
jgi:hypothetical protein